MNNDTLDAANLIDRIARLSRADEKSRDLYPVQWTALRDVARANRFSRTPMALSRYLGATRGTTSQTLMALERKGYVKRRPSPRDKRSVELALTDKAVKTLAHDPIMVLASSINEVLGRESGTLRTQLVQVLESLVEQNGGRKFGECRTCRHFVREASPKARGEHYCGLLKMPLSDEDSVKICVEQA